MGTARIAFRGGGRGDRKFAYKLKFRPWKNNFIDPPYGIQNRKIHFFFGKIIKMYVYAFGRHNVFQY
jgi:hypothetical protein